MTNRLIEINKATVARFLAGTHSADIDDVDVIDDTVVAAHRLPRLSRLSERRIL